MQMNVGAWARHNFPDDDRVCAVGSVTEEVGELLRAARKQKQQIRGTHEEWDAELRKEAGDVLIALFQAADNCGFDLYEAYRLRWNEVALRDFRADPKGHGLPE